MEELYRGGQQMASRLYLSNIVISVTIAFITIAIEKEIGVTIAEL